MVSEGTDSRLHCGACVAYKVRLAARLERETETDRQRERDRERETETETERGLIDDGELEVCRFISC